MSSTNQPPDLSTAMSTLAVSAPDDPSVAVPRRRLAPHRKYAQKFLTLPDELLTNISENVAPGDLPDFRLTCKTLANIAAKQFGEKRLARRRFIFTEYSLKGLVDMTAHPIFGPCIKSIMFGTDHLTNELEALMNALKSHKITDPAEAMDILHEYHEHCKKNSKFFGSRELSRMLEAALTNLLSHGTSVSLGIFNNMRDGRCKPFLMNGYGSSRENNGLPFTRLMTVNTFTLATIRSACRAVNFRPSFLELDLRGQGRHEGMANALSKLLLFEEELQSELDVCIRDEWLDIRFSLSLNRLEFRQRHENNLMLTGAEHIRFDMRSLGSPFRDALLSAPFTHLHMESCSMWSGDFVDVLESLAETLQEVELVDVAFWGDQCNVRNLEPVLQCLRHDLHLQTLVLDDVRAMNKDYSDYTGIRLAKGRFWHGHQQIHAGLDILIGFDGEGWDFDLDDWFEDGIENIQQDLQDMDYSQYEGDMTYTEFLEHKASLEEDWEHHKEEYQHYKRVRAGIKEAMARVEAGEFST